MVSKLGAAALYKVYLGNTAIRKVYLGSDVMSLTPSFITNVPVILTRATEAWSQDLSGNLYRFAPGVPRQTNRGWQISGAATRLHGEAPTNGANNGSTTSTLAAEGLFNPLRVISGGSVNNRRATVSFAITNATPVYIRGRIRAGTSGRVRIIPKNNTANTLTVLHGPVASVSTVVSDAGAITNLVNRLLPNGDRELTFTWTPNATAASAEIAIGPDSAVTGEYIDVIAMQAATAYTDWIMGGTGTKAIAADIMSINLTGLDMSAGFMLRMDGIVDATPRREFDRFYTAGINDGRITTFVNPSDGQFRVAQVVASVNQANVTIRNAVTPPAAFAIIGAHGVNYVGGASGSSVATPDMAATYVTPSVLRIGSDASGTANLPLTLTAIRLVPGAPTTPKVTELAA